MLFTTPNTEELILNFSKEDLNYILVAEKSELDINRLIDQCNEQGYQVAGGIFPMIIHEYQYLDSGIILQRIDAVESPILLKNLDSSDKPLDLPDISQEIESCLILVDGLMSGIPKLLDRLYDKYWNKISYIGGGCGSLSLEQMPCVFTNEGLFTDVALLVMSQKKAQLGMNHGWQKIKGPFIANKTDGNTILELNWRPAFEVYKEVVEAYSGMTFTDDNFFDIAKGFPFGISREGMEDVVRDPIATGEKGELFCVGQVRNNVVLNILMGDKEQLIESAKRASQKAVSVSSPSKVFVVDCISRVLYLEDKFSDELKMIKEVLDTNEVNAPLEGVLSLGEISSDKSGYLEFYNKTIVVSAFY